MCHLPPGTENRCVPWLGGGGGCSAYYGINRGGGHQRGQWETLRGGGGENGTNTLAAYSGGYDGTNTLAASPGGGGQTPWGHPPGGGGWDKHPGATQLPHPDEECESYRGKGGEG